MVRKTTRATSGRLRCFGSHDSANPSVLVNESPFIEAGFVGLPLLPRWCVFANFIMSSRNDGRISMALQGQSY
jgi:hypothetical protein